MRCSVQAKNVDFGRVRGFFSDPRDRGCFYDWIAMVWPYIGAGIMTRAQYAPASFVAEALVTE